MKAAYSPREAAAQTPLSEYSIRDAINRGLLKAKRHGTRLVITHEALMEFIDNMPDAGDQP